MGYHASPLGFPPHTHSGKGRFDGPAKLFRTLYCSQSPLTCFRETLFHFRPSVEARNEFARFGKRTWSHVPLDWRRAYVLVPAEIEVSEPLLSLDDQSLLVSLEVELADQLLERRIKHLTLGEIQGSDRGLTKAIARALFARGAAGIRYPSKYDSGWCAALFEGRARLLERGDPRSLAQPIPEFEQVCSEYDLTLE